MFNSTRPKFYNLILHTADVTSISSLTNILLISNPLSSLNFSRKNTLLYRYMHAKTGVRGQESVVRKTPLASSPHCMSLTGHCTCAGVKGVYRYRHEEVSATGWSGMTATGWRIWSGMLTCFVRDFVWCASVYLRPISTQVSFHSTVFYFPAFQTSSDRVSSRREIFFAAMRTATVLTLCAFVGVANTQVQGADLCETIHFCAW